MHDAPCIILQNKNWTVFVKESSCTTSEHILPSNNPTLLYATSASFSKSLNRVLLAVDRILYHTLISQNQILSELHIYLGGPSNTTLRILSAKGDTPQIRKKVLLKGLES